MTDSSRQTGRLRFGAVGDIAVNYCCGDALATHGPTWPFECIQDILAEADLLFGNMEEVILPSDYPEEQIEPAGLVTRRDPTPALAAGGFDFLNLAANHVLDGGHVSMFHTRDRLERAGIATAGVGEAQQEARQMCVLKAQGLRVGFLCYSEDCNYTLSTTGPCFAYYHPEDVIADVRANRDTVDVLVVSIHADLEFMETPSVPRRDAFRRISEAGADIVLGHHPHVPQGVEFRDGRLIAYSLGNCVFPAHSSEYMRSNGPHTGHSFLLLVDVTAEGVQGFERRPFEIHTPPRQRPVALQGRAAKEREAYFRHLDSLCTDDEVVSGNWRAIARKHFRMYLDRIREMDDEAVLETILPKLLLVDENRRWVEEVLADATERWKRRSLQVDPLHRPSYWLGRPRPDETGR